MRIDGWPDRLIAEVERHRGMAFEWGASDCVSFFADCVVAITGDDPAADFRGWFSKRSAASRMRSKGLKSIEAGVLARFPSIPVAMAGRGDLVYPAKVDKMMAPAVITGAHAISRNEDGWVSIERARWHKAFRVG